MKCPKCGRYLHGIPPLEKEEFLCVNEDCQLYGKEIYGGTQEKLNKFIKDMGW